MVGGFYINELILIKMKKEIKYLLEIAGQYLILNELEYEKYLIYGVLT